MNKTSGPKKSLGKGEVKENTFPVVAIGASAGGLEAMMEFLKYLPADTGMAYIYVQHLSPDHKSLLTEILSKKTKMIVQEIDDMDKIQPNNVFVIPFNKGIEVTDGHIKLIPRSETSAAITIDVLFSTLAEAQKERVIGIVLSGSASDGTLGMKAIKHEGGLTFAQDDSAKFTSMPHSAIAAGAVDFILSPKEMALELARLSTHPLIKTIGVKNGEEDLIENSDPDLKNILQQLHKATGVDFNGYKMNTIKRRIIRRMLLYKIATLKEYAKLLALKKEEIDILFQDLLINVTRFFRDTDSHNYLKESLFPKLLSRKKPGDSLRIWVPACASGEESYSIAMMLLEIQESKTTSIPVQIFATDLSEQSIRKARIGLYSKPDLEAVSPKRIQRFFTKADGGFRVNKAIRDMCVFAPHNILSDPPFSRLDFISCCNLFIYFDNPAQKKAVNTFHYALNEDGFLMLGKSENISHSTNLFTAFNKKYKIFSRKVSSGSRILPTILPRNSQQINIDLSSPVLTRTKTKQSLAVNHNGLDNAIDTLLVTEFMPASVVINHQMEIVQFRGNTDLFLTHPKGKATFNILKMARPEIAFELRNAISKVIKTKIRERKGGIEVKINDIQKIVCIEIVPLHIEWDEPLILILFSEQVQIEGIFLNNEVGGNGGSLAKDRRIKKLEMELAAAQANALSIAQEQEAFTEELQSANEEVVSSNEELQTVNEELETSKEEIESANEELITTNQELQTRNDLLNEAYGYSEAVFETIHEPMIVLDKNFRVKSANKTFYKIFKVKEDETEGVLLYDLGNRQWNIPRLRELLEDLLPKNTHFHDFEITHTFPLIGEKTMLLNARRIIQKMNHEELILLAITDVTELRAKANELQQREKEILLLEIEAEKNLRKKIEDREKQYNLMLMQSPFAFAVLKGKDMVVAFANDSMKEMWGKGKHVEGRAFIEILPELKEQVFPALLHNVYTTGIPYVANEILARMERNGKMEDLYFNFVYQPYRETDNTISGVTVIAIEVTQEAKYNLHLKESEERFRSLADNMPLNVFIIEPSEKIRISYWNKYWLDYTGQTMEEALGNSWEGIVHPKDLQLIMDKFLFAFKIQKPYHLPYIRIKRFDGQYRWFAIQANPRFLSNGEFMGFIGVGYDIHEQKLVEEALIVSEEKFKLIFEKSLAPIIVADDLGNYISVNKAAAEAFEYPINEMLKMNVGELNTTFRPNAAELYAEYMENGKETGEFGFTSKNGTPKIMMYEAVRIRPDFNLSIMMEVTEQKRIAEELKAAKMQAEKAMNAKQQFLSNMSHEIRTPLNSILGFTNVLMKTDLALEQKEYLQAINTSGKSLHVLINDILDLAKVDAGKMTFAMQPFELQKSLKSLLYTFDLKVKEKNLELVKEYDSKIPQLLLGDSLRLNQIILNLISNAVKFTHKGKIRVKVQLAKETQDEVVVQFTVSDTGIGIEADKIHSVFSYFEQAETGIAHTYGGTGLGLAIVKQLVEAQGGSIALTSKHGEGSSFSFSLPFGKTSLETKEEIKESKSDTDMNKLKILVAEDVALNQLLIKIILSDFGFEHEVVENGKMAIEKMQTNTYDLILMDLQMPEMDGFEATKFIRNNLKSDIPIIALTADVTTADVAKCKAAGMDDYISKPIEETQLYSKIVELVKRRN